LTDIESHCTRQSVTTVPIDNVDALVVHSLETENRGQGRASHRVGPQKIPMRVTPFGLFMQIAEREIRSRRCVKGEKELEM
jgi:hypothetical protein